LLSIGTNINDLDLGVVVAAAATLQPRTYHVPRCGIFPAPSPCTVIGRLACRAKCCTGNRKKRPGSIPGAGHVSRYVFSYPGQLSLTDLSWESAVSTSQKAVTPWGWRVKAGTVRVWVAGKTGWSPCYTRAIYERFRDKGLTKALYKFICLFFFTFYRAACNASAV